MHRDNRVAFCIKWVWVPQGGNKIQKYAQIIGFSLSVLVQLEKNEGVTTERFNSNNNKNVFRNEVHRNNRVAFCNKWVWGTPGGNKIQKYAQIIRFSLSVLVQLEK